MRIFGHHPLSPDQPKPPKNGPWDVKNARHHEHGTPLSGWKIQNRNADPEMEKKHSYFCLISVSASGFFRLQRGFSENGHHFKKRFILEKLRFSNVTNSRASRDTFRIVIPYTYLHGWGELSCMAPSTHPETNMFEDYFSVGIPSFQVRTASFREGFLRKKSIPSPRIL